MREPETLRLDQFDETDWWDMVRVLRPDITDEQIELDWIEFCEWKRKGALN